MAKKKVTIKFTIDEKTGKITNVSNKNDKKGKKKNPKGTVTDSCSMVVATSSPHCFYVQIDGIWYQFCV